MFYLLFIFLNILNSTLMLVTTHPLATGLSLLSQTVLICLLSGMIMKSFWFSYILFLIFLGGMLVLFIYVTSLASNELFKLSKNLIIFMFFFITMIFIILTISDKTFYLSNIFSPDSMKMNEVMNFINENSLILNKLFNYPINIFTILLMIYLFLTLIVVVKITNIFEGPLRPKF